MIWMILWCDIKLLGNVEGLRTLLWSTLSWTKYKAILVLCARATVWIVRVLECECEPLKLFTSQSLVIFVTHIAKFLLICKDVAEHILFNNENWWNAIFLLMAVYI
jgi:hypothetical protein